MTGGRIKRARSYLGDEPFCLTYGDGVSDINVCELIKFHRRTNALVTVSAVRPPGRFGVLHLRSGEDYVAASVRSRTRTATTSMAVSSSSTPRRWTTSTATTRCGNASPWRSWCAKAGSRRTGTAASGRTWTRYATRWCSRNTGEAGGHSGRTGDGQRDPDERDCRDEDCRVVVTVADGVIGSGRDPLLAESAATIRSGKAHSVLVGELRD